MSTWNYRIIFHDDEPEEPYYGLHEVYYTNDGKVSHWTEEAVIVGDTAEEIARVVKMMADDISHHDLLIHSDF